MAYQRAAWRKSVRSDAGQGCVEVAPLPGTVGVRDSKNPDGGALVLSHSTWTLIMAGVKDGRLDL
ncbi:DUF397 domain-containing protein [Actinomadura hibisca]|uniref:DUF397 domain-containing protein n=1 Tax=Actinomadura hibisca TaxID=68565 RepID=UPI0027D7BFEF|nr:DUF397 domain-containing protein [Actinomadura hibisca]